LDEEGPWLPASDIVSNCGGNEHQIDNYHLAWSISSASLVSGDFQAMQMTKLHAGWLIEDDYDNGFVYQGRQQCAFIANS